MPSRDLTYRLFGEDKSASRALEKVAHAAGNAGRRIDFLGGIGARATGTLGKSFGALRSRLDIVGTGLKAAVVGVGAMGAAGGVLGVKTAASMEQAQIAFETMLGSAGKAKVFLKGLADFAAKTPFEFPELQTAASSLVSAGIHASKVIPIMRTLGDVTSGMGTGSEGVKRATVALQQMSAAGRITGEDLNQLRDAGIPVFDLLAAATGKSKAEVVKLAQAGKLGGKELAQLMRALETGKGLERFSGLMEKQAQSLNGLWSTFKDTLGMGLAKLLTPAIPALKAGLGAITTVVGSAFEGIGKVADAATKGFKDGAILGGPGFLGFVRDLAANLTNFFLVLTGGSDAVAGEALNGFTRFAEVLRRVGAVMRDDVAPALATVARFVRAEIGPIVTDFVQRVASNAARVLPVLGRVFRDDILPAFQVVARFVVTNVLPVFRAVSDFMQQTVLPTAIKLAGVLAGWLRSAFETVSRKIEENRPQLEQLGRVLRTVAEFIVTKVAPVLAHVLGAALQTAGDAIGFLIDYIGFMVRAFGTVIRVGGNMASAMISGFRSMLAAALEAFGAIVHGGATALGWVPGIGDKLKGADKAFRDFKTRTLKTLDAMAVAADALGEKTGSKLKEGFTRAVGTGLNTVVSVTPNGFIFEQATAPRRALGGPAFAGLPYAVGERRAEMFVPDANGRIEPRVTAGGSAGSSIDYDKLARAIVRALTGATLRIDAGGRGRITVDDLVRGG